MGSFRSETTVERAKAARHFVRAAAALTEADDASLTFALFEASLGMLALAKADADCRANDAVTRLLEDEKAARHGGGER